MCFHQSTTLLHCDVLLKMLNNGIDALVDAAYVNVPSEAFIIETQNDLIICNIKNIWLWFQLVCSVSNTLIFFSVVSTGRHVNWGCGSATRQPARPLSASPSKQTALNTEEFNPGPIRVRWFQVAWNVQPFLQKWVTHLTVMQWQFVECER